MSYRKLAALGYPSDNIDCSDKEQVRYLVEWLEDNFIQRIAEEERSKIRTKSLDEWEPIFVQYLETLECPLMPKAANLSEVVEWLLDHAINNIYSKNDVAMSLTSARLADMKLERKQREHEENPFSCLELSDGDVRKGIEELRSAIGIAPYPDPHILLSACCKYIRENLTDNAIRSRREKLKTQRDRPKTMQLSHLDMGMVSTKESQVDAAARCLRLLHLENLREAQTQVNETIVAIQNVTADPKTDRRLGKVGF
ncbi:hypothetical protein AB6A40_007476 [Gnathostoma spinigerum]|uniref:Uncharacterized protein n=1 Tax=Gnathostoma spinigerum TaxID=75299 RepID=A0ABD6EW15_9BILA